MSATKQTSRIFPASVVRSVAALDHCDVFAQSYPKDWSADDGDVVGAWQYWEAVRCHGCKRPMVLTSQATGDHHAELVPASTWLTNAAGRKLRKPARPCTAAIYGGQGPMMARWYPVDEYNFDPEVAAKAIVDLPLCVVEVDDAYGFALTGGGEDLTWEIAAAYVAIGRLPPLYWVRRLLATSSAGLDVEAHLSIIAASLATLAHVRKHVERDRRDIEGWLVRECKQAKKPRKSARKGGGHVRR